MGECIIDVHVVMDGVCEEDERDEGDGLRAKVGEEEPNDGDEEAKEK
jgi:hypothetical protein